MYDEPILSGIDWIKYYCNLFLNKEITVIDTALNSPITGTLVTSDGIIYSLSVNGNIYIIYKKFVRYIDVDDQTNPTQLTIYI